MRRVVIAGLMIMAACGPGLPEGATGQEVYDASCARCHGSDLKGTSLAPGLGPGSEFVDKDDAYATQTITRGRGSMPSFGNALSGDQIERVLNYLREQP